MIRVTSLFRRPVEPKTITVEVGDASFAVRVSRNRRARRYTLRIHAASREAVLTMPLRGNLADASRFAHAHGGWLAQRLRQLPTVAPFSEGELVPLRGIDHRIVHRPRTRGTVWAAQDGDEPLLCVAGSREHVARRVRDFLKREARRDLEAAVSAYAQALEVRVRRISIRDQSSRWGSCNSAGVLSFSWRLILCPPFVLDYLAAHEVAHLVEMNHSARFWKLLRQMCPATDEATRWLDSHGNALHRYGAAKESDQSPI
jgi:predicted metal-dependent hydrolase